MYPKINDFVYLQVASSDEKEGRTEYKSRISDIEEDAFLIEVPMEIGHNRLKRLFIGEELSVYFMSESGTKNYFNTYVLGFTNEVVRQVRIRKPNPDSITQIQRRNFLRVPAELELALGMKNGERLLVITDDVGGGGVSYYTDQSHPVTEEEQLDCWLLIPYKNGLIEHAHFEAEVVRQKKMESGKQQIMLKYIGITDFERQKIIRYCFERQFDFRNR
ncbi:flagellar brake protein [Paenibacillus pinistramenti]|uniref:flagellar brake protein n=1 Tax=Paenibacillus pinistramenti TaxID=1768003 RepID=UPI00193A51F1|nr:flagellar brake domain-containing protein [Paenibacillus pinistramenti]